MPFLRDPGLFPPSTKTSRVDAALIESRVGYEVAEAIAGPRSERKAAHRLREATRKKGCRSKRFGRSASGGARPARRDREGFVRRVPKSTGRSRRAPLRVHPLYRESESSRMGGACAHANWQVCCQARPGLGSSFVGVRCGPSKGRKTSRAASFGSPAGLAHEPRAGELARSESRLYRPALKPPLVLEASP
ncbi:hypothetical protein KM043_012229 [Ampulex compressa]|nr:hypothetical protein KM043_012229 [Ampulex compressa]